MNKREPNWNTIASEQLGARWRCEKCFKRTAKRIWSGFNKALRFTSKCHTGFFAGRRTSQGNTHIWHTAFGLAFDLSNEDNNGFDAMKNGIIRLIADGRKKCSEYASRNICAPFSWKIVTSNGNKENAWFAYILSIRPIRPIQLAHRPASELFFLESFSSSLVIHRGCLLPRANHTRNK